MQYGGVLGYSFLILQGEVIQQFLGPGEFRIVGKSLFQNPTIEVNPRFMEFQKFSVGDFFITHYPGPLMVHVVSEHFPHDIVEERGGGIRPILISIGPGPQNIIPLTGEGGNGT